MSWSLVVGPAVGSIYEMVLGCCLLVVSYWQPVWSKVVVCG